VTAASASPRPQHRAFVTFLMFNDSYLPGCLMAAHGLREQKSSSRRACVVTRDVSAQARDALDALYDDVIETEYIPLPAQAASIRSSETRTGSARVEGGALTRFASLRLGRDGDLGGSFEKVVLIDADVLPIRDFDTLWALPAPAGIINERREHMVELDREGSLVVRPDTSTWIWHDVYGAICPHGAPIPREITDRVAFDPSNFGVNGSLILLEPSMAAYEDFIRWVSTPAVSGYIRRWPWIDQQAATLYWSGRWTSVDPSFSTLYGYPSLELARGLHFAGIKPWSWRKKGFERRLVKFPDYRLWGTLYVEMLDAVPELREHPGLRRIEREIRTVLEGPRSRPTAG
jgi:glycosyl transferase family 8